MLKIVQNKYQFGIRNKTLEPLNIKINLYDSK